MEVLSVLLAVFLFILSVILIYVAQVSKNYGIFKKLGIPSLSPVPAVGNFLEIAKVGFLEFHKHHYRAFAPEKVYGYYEPGTALMAIRDLDMIRDIMVKHFNSFVNRRIITKEKPFHSMMTVLEDDHWRHVRNTVSPVFSTGKLRQMCQHVERSSKGLVSNLREACDSHREVELKEVLSCYTMDVIASTGFGVSIDSLKDSPFVQEAKNIMSVGNKMVVFAFLFPALLKLMTKLGFGLFPKKSIDFFLSFVDAAKANRLSGQGGEKAEKRNDFIQLVINDENKTDDDKKGLTYDEVQGQALIFILAGYDTVSTTLSFCLFCLANNPQACAQLQEEVDAVLQGRAPSYENVQALPYMDMCLNETMRLYPPGFVTDRVCTEDCTVQGVHIPKGMVVVFPVIAIHNDPQYFPEPEKFDPERFSPEKKDSRHPFAHLPFGQGPRNCIGMRLALMEMKIALAAILQEMTPVPCPKTVYPPRLLKFQLLTEDGVWVQMEKRNKQEE